MLLVLFSLGTNIHAQKFAKIRTFQLTWHTTRQTFITSPKTVFTQSSKRVDRTFAQVAKMNKEEKKETLLVGLIPAERPLDF